jgi:hypothetical protein
MTEYIIKRMYLEKSKQKIIWNERSTSYSCIANPEQKTIFLFTFSQPRGRPDTSFGRHLRVASTLKLGIGR